MPPDSLRQTVVHQPAFFFALSPALAVICFLFAADEAVHGFTHTSFLGIARARTHRRGWRSRQFLRFLAGAVRGKSPAAATQRAVAMLLAVAVVFWLSIGFDIIYALQDYRFDCRTVALVRWGPKDVRSQLHFSRIW